MATSSALALENGRSALKVHGSALLALTYQGIGIVYADLGTSPLYTLNGLWPPDEPVPSKADVIGGVSAVLWAILFLPLMKYILICLEFGTREGEGGPFALFQGLFPRQNPDGESGVRLHREARSSKPTPKLNPSFKHPLLVWTLLGTSLTLADGVLTPAVSVTAAVSGIAAAKPSVSDHLVPISIGFLLALFLAQPMGTARLASVFSPTIIIWFALIAAIGVANIITYPGILRAFDPSRAVLFFVRTGRYDVLSGVLLALGGCEAIFANLGQFNALSIRISFTTVVLPSILLSYLGQGARLIRDKGNVLDDIFYQTIPGPSNGLLFWLTYVIAILATLIASQALVTATFSLVQQLVNMESLPPMEIRYTSNTTQGQVYIPVANWILMIACIACVAGFKGNEALTNAYGFAVATVMFTTTVLVALQMYYVKGLSVFIALAFLVVFGFLDGLLWGATVRKVPHGAWFPLTAGVVLMLFMLFWTWAKGLEVAFDDGNRRDLWSFITSSSDMEEKETDTYSDRQTISSQSYLSGIELQQTNRLKRTPTGMETCYYVREDVDPDLPPTAKTKVLTRIDTCAIFHKLSAGRGVPPSFVGFIDHWPALPRVIIFLSAEVASVPKVEPEDQYYLRKIHPSQCFYSVTYRRGYRESYGAKFEDIIDRVCQLEFSIEGRRDRRQVEALIQDIRRSAETCTHVAPYYNILSKQLENTTLIGRILNWCRRILLEKVYRRISALSNQASDERSDPSRLFYVGVNASI